MSAKIKNIKKVLLSDNWYYLYKYSFDFLRSDGEWERHDREVYDRGNGAAILLMNPEMGTVVLTSQFRIPTFVNGNDTGMMIEVPAGLLDGLDPQECIKKEVEEETGYHVSNVTKVLETYMSPGSVTEILYLFIGNYEENMKISEGGGDKEETEHIEVLELPFKEVLQMVSDGRIRDAKSILLIQYAALHHLIE